MTLQLLAEAYGGTFLRVAVPVFLGVAAALFGVRFLLRQATGL